MKYLLSLLTVAAFALVASPTPAAETSVALEPYGLVSWTGLNGEAELGAGANLTLGITKNLSVVSFAESDSTEGIFVDRLGAGLRYTAPLGSRVSLDAGVAGGYDLTDPHFFLRLPVGATFTAFKSKNADLGLRVQYAFDIDGNGKHGSATGRLFAGPVFNLKW